MKQRITRYSIDDVKGASKFGNTGPSGWGFHVWIECRDGTDPHRALLENITIAHPEVILTLPEVEPYEDYVEGSISTGSHEVWVYFETVLSHVWLWSAERQSAEWISALVKNLTK